MSYPILFGNMAGQGGVLPFPSDISGLLYSIDASNNSTLSLSGSSVTSWTASNGSVTFTNGNSSQRPVVQTINGKQGVYFDGTRTLISSQSFSPSTFTSFFACQISTGGMILELTPDANNGGFYLYEFGNSAYVVRSGSGGNGFNLFSGWQNSTSPATIMHRYDGTNTGHQVWKNNSQLGTGTSSSNVGSLITSGQLYLMSRGANSLYATGYMFESLLYNRALTEAESTRVHNYLVSKWT